VRVNTFITINLPLYFGTDPGLTLRLVENAKRHLIAAIVVYLCHEVAQQPLWTRRIEWMRSEKKAFLHECFDKAFGFIKSK
jgi:hypothetical protein